MRQRGEGDSGVYFQIGEDATNKTKVFSVTKYVVDFNRMDEEAAVVIDYYCKMYEIKIKILDKD